MRRLTDRAAMLLWQRTVASSQHTFISCRPLPAASSPARRSSSDFGRAADAAAARSAQLRQKTGSNNIRRLHAVSAAAALQSDAQSGADDRAISLAFPTFMVWGANTDVGKTLVSAGLAAAAARGKVRCCRAVIVAHVSQSRMPQG